jgi:hypothetical protein
MYFLSRERLDADRKHLKELYDYGLICKLAITEVPEGPLENYFVPLEPPSTQALRILPVYFPWVRILNDMGRELSKLNRGR